MSLPERIWRALNLDPATMRAQARFHHGYAELGDGPFGVRDIAELFRFGRPEGLGDRVVDLLSEEGQALAARLGDDRRPSTGQAWVRPAEIADSLRTAAIANLLLSTAAGRADLIAAGQRYQSDGLPFGDFLLEAAADDRRISTGAANRLQAVLSGERDDNALDPTQLRYLLLASAPDLAELAPFLSDAPQARLSVSVGATAQPFSTWWRIGDLIGQLKSRQGRERDEARRRLAQAITEVANAHGRQLELAMADQFHWAAGHSRVDVVDLDLTGAVAISAHVINALQLRPWELAVDFAGLALPAQVSIVIGLQLGGPDLGPDDSPAPDPFGPAPVREGDQDLHHDVS